MRVPVRGVQLTLYSSGDSDLAVNIVKCASDGDLSLFASPSSIAREEFHVSLTARMHYSKTKYHEDTLC